MAISINRGVAVVGAWSTLALLVVAGCQMSTASTAPGSTATQPAIAEKGGAELWAQTCNHCHNLRSPSTYGPAQWEVAVYDMRVRAHLTGDEQRKILAFLKASS